MDNVAEVIKEYSNLLTERIRVKDYLACAKTYAEIICAKMELADIDVAIKEVGERLERLNLYTEIINSLE